MALRCLRRIVNLRRSRPRCRSVNLSLPTCFLLLSRSGVTPLLAALLHGDYVVWERNRRDGSWSSFYGWRGNVGDRWQHIGCFLKLPVLLVTLGGMREIPVIESFHSGGCFFPVSSFVVCHQRKGSFSNSILWYNEARIKRMASFLLLCWYTKRPNMSVLELLQPPSDSSTTK